MKKERSGGQKKTAVPPGSSTKPAPPAWWRQDWFFILALLTITFLAYQPVWHAGFLTDDGVLVLKNPLVQQHDGWWRVWFNRGSDYVPATTLTFWAEWQVWAGQPLGYHLDNVLLHAFDAILIWRILRRLRIPGARLPALLFALHPVNVASAAWVAERKNTLAMAFYAAAILSYLIFEDTGRWRWYGFSAAAFILGILSKSAVAPLPVVLLGLAWWQRDTISLTDARRSVPFFALAIAAGAIGVENQHVINGAAVIGPSSFWARFAGAGRAVWFYLEKALWPHDLMFIYPKWHIDPGKPAAYLPALLVIAVMVVSWCYRRGWGKALLFSFGYFVVMLLPVLGLADISFMVATQVADHWLYFAIIGPIALVAAVLTILFARCNPGLRVGLCAVLLAATGTLTWDHSGAYVNSTVFWRTNLERNPRSFMTQSGYGNVLFQMGRVQEAIAHYQEALDLEPSCVDAHYDLGNIYLQEGQPVEAAFHFKEVLKVDPDHTRALNNLAWILATCPDGTLRDGNKAVAMALRADKLSEGKDPSVIGTLAAGYTEAGQFPLAVSTAVRASQLPEAQAHPAFMQGLQQQLNLYRNGLPFRDASQIMKPTPGR